jgi:hypothetical protein
MRRFAGAAVAAEERGPDATEARRAAGEKASGDRGCERAARRPPAHVPWFSNTLETCFAKRAGRENGAHDEPR